MRETTGIASGTLFCPELLTHTHTHTHNFNPYQFTVFLLLGGKWRSSSLRRVSVLTMFCGQGPRHGARDTLLSVSDYADKSKMSAFTFTQDICIILSKILFQSFTTLLFFLCLFLSLVAILSTGSLSLFCNFFPVPLRGAFWRSLTVCLGPSGAFSSLVV